MKLIKLLETIKVNNKTRRLALFECPYCLTNIKLIKENGLRNKSCGCIKYKLLSESMQNNKRNFKHGKLNSRLYSIWQNMKRRCIDPNKKGYKNYGGKGIEVCKEWFNSFLVFEKWALSNGYQEHLTIDRKDSNKNYNPFNCQWLTLEDNSRKTSRCKNV